MNLTLQKVSKEFKGKTAVQHLSLTLTPGVYGLIGANGAGKTSLMRMICGVTQPTTGTIEYNGQPITLLDEQYRQELGYLPQNFGYYPDFTAKQFMHYIASLKGISSREAKGKTTELLALVGLSDVANRKIKTYSGGMKQRLGIAQAVLNDPKILVLDEPTAGLDPKERIRFRNLISDLSKDRIVILSTHIVSDIEYIADTILMMKDGSIILNQANEDVLNEIDGKVWQCVVSHQEIQTLSDMYRIVNLQHEGNNIALRIVSETKPHASAVYAKPTLEDLFLFYFEEGHVE